MSIIKNDGTELAANELLAFCESIKSARELRSYLESVILQRKGMSIEEIVKYLCDKSDIWCTLQRYEQEEIAKIIQPLINQQSFVPDWNKAPYSGVKGITWQYVYQSENEIDGGYDGYIPRPKVKRMRTDEEIGRALWDFGIRFEGEANRKKVWADLPKSVKDDLCRAAGISLETEE